jgi:hypothetical protein
MPPMTFEYGGRDIVARSHRHGDAGVGTDRCGTKC